MLDGLVFDLTVVITYHVCLHSVGQISYCTSFVFIWVAGILRDDVGSGGRFPVIIICKLLFSPGNSKVQIV
jgi:hypothetical protein